MLILSMLMKITNFTQAQFASYIGVTRATVNYWLNGNNISFASKQLIAKKFGFPISYFDVSLEENIETYKIIYATLYDNYNKTNGNQDKIQEILNEIEFDDKTVNQRELTENDIINGLLNGFDPFTGELFDKNHILNNIAVKSALLRLTKNKKSYENLTKEEQEKYKKLESWRNNKYEMLNLKNASMVINNKDLLNIVTEKINTKKDLLKIKGFGIKKYNLYSDELMELLRG